MYRYLFLFLFIVLFFLIHYFSIKSFILKLDISKRYKSVLKVLVWFNFFSFVGYISSRYFFDIPNILYYIFSLSIGVVLLLFLSTIFYTIVYFLQKRVEILDRYKRWIDIAFLLFLFGYFILALYSVNPKLVYVNIDEKLLPRSYKIAQISDLHIGALVGKDKLEEIVKKINRQNVDLVVITGDLIDSKLSKSKNIVDELKNLKSKYGTFYIVGNHEYFRGVKEILSYMKSIGVKVLENSSMKVGDFYIAGVYDSRRRSKNMDMNITKAYEDIPNGSPVLLLMHRPSGIKRLNGFTPSLILSGHTHGGQIWPFGYIVKLYEPYLKGLHRLSDKSYIYVNSGTGFWGPPMRVGTSSEITIIGWR